MGEMRNAYRIIVGKPEGKRSLGRPRRRWEDNNNKMYLKEIGCESLDRINLIDHWRILMNTVMNLRFHKRGGIFTI
jgi:hypothetical protein